MITRFDFLLRTARHELRARFNERYETKKRRNEKKTADTPWPRGEIFREAIAITGERARNSEAARSLRSHNAPAGREREKQERERERKENQFAIIINGSE